MSRSPKFPRHPKPESPKDASRDEVLLRSLRSALSNKSPLDVNRPDSVSNLGIFEVEAPWRSGQISPSKRSPRLPYSHDSPGRVTSTMRQNRPSGDRQRAVPSSAHQVDIRSEKRKDRVPSHGVRNKKHHGSSRRRKAKDVSVLMDGTKPKMKGVSRPNPVGDDQATLDDAIKRQRKSLSRDEPTLRTVSKPTPKIPLGRESKRRSSSKPQQEPYSKREKVPEPLVRTKLSVTQFGSLGGALSSAALDVDPKWIRAGLAPVPKTRTKLTDSSGVQSVFASSAHEPKFAGTTFLQEAPSASDRMVKPGTSGGSYHSSSPSPEGMLSMATAVARAVSTSDLPSSDLILSERLWSPESCTGPTTPVSKAARLAPSLLNRQGRLESNVSLISDASSKRHHFFSATEGTDRFSEMVHDEEQPPLTGRGHGIVPNIPLSAPLNSQETHRLSDIKSDCFFSASEGVQFNETSRQLDAAHIASSAHEQGQCLEKRRKSLPLDDTRLTEGSLVLNTAPASAEPSNPNDNHDKTGPHASSSRNLDDGDVFFSAAEKVFSDEGQREGATESELPFFSMSDPTTRQDPSALSTGHEVVAPKMALTTGKPLMNSSASGIDNFFSLRGGTVSALPRTLSVIQEHELSRERLQDTEAVKPADIHTPEECHEHHTTVGVFVTTEFPTVATVCNELEGLLGIDPGPIIPGSESQMSLTSTTLLDSIVDAESGIVRNDGRIRSTAEPDNHDFNPHTGEVSSRTAPTRAFQAEGLSSFCDASTIADKRETPISGSDDPFYTASDMKGSLVEKSKANVTPEARSAKLCHAEIRHPREGSSSATEMLFPDFQYPFLTDKELKAYLGELTRKLSSTREDNFFTASGSPPNTEENRYSVSERKPFTEQGTKREAARQSVEAQRHSRPQVINRPYSFGDNVPVAPSRLKSPQRAKERVVGRTTSPNAGGLLCEHGALRTAGHGQRSGIPLPFRRPTRRSYLYPSKEDRRSGQLPLDECLLLQEDSWEPVGIVAAEPPRLLAIHTTRAFASRLSDRDDERFLRALTRIPPFSGGTEQLAPSARPSTTTDAPASDTFATAKSSVTKSASDPNFVAIKTPFLPLTRSRSDSVLLEVEKHVAIDPPAKLAVVPSVLQKSSAVPAVKQLPRRAPKAKERRKEVGLKTAPAQTNVSSREAETPSLPMAQVPSMEPAVSMTGNGRTHSKELLLGMMAVTTTVFGLVLVVSALNSKSTAVRVLADDQRAAHDRTLVNVTVFATRSPEPVPSPDNFVCSHERCIADGKYLSSSLSWDHDPCDDFYEFACSKWRHSRAASALVEGGSSYSVLEDLERDLERRVARLLAVGRVQELEPLRRLHDACSNANAINSAGWAPLGQLLSLCGLPDWPYETPVKASAWRAAARALAFTNAEVFVSVAVTDHPTRRDRHIIALDRPRLILRPSDLPGDVHWLRDTAEAAMTAFRERPARLAAETVALAQRLARLAFSRDLESDVRLHRVSSLVRFPQLLQLLSTLFENVSAVHESSEVLLRSEGFVQDLLDEAEGAHPRTVLNYVGLRVVVHSAAFLPDVVGLQAVHARVLLPHRSRGGFVARSQLCIRQAADTLPYLFLLAARLLFGGSQTERALATLVNALRRQLLNQIPSLAFLDAPTRYRCSEIISSTRLHILGPPLLTDQAAIRVHVKALPSLGSDPPLLWFASTNAHVTRIRLLRFSRYGWTGGVFDRDCSVDLQSNAVFVPPLFLNASAPLDRSLLFLQIPHLGARLLRCLLILLSAGVSNRGNRELLTRGWWSEPSKARLESMRRCLVRQRFPVDEPAAAASLNQVADVAAISPALALFQRHLANVARSSRQFRLPGAEDLTPAGLFFAYYALSRCRREASSQDRLAAAEAVNAPLRNNDAFHAAFECRVGVRMNPDSKCYAWLE